MEALEIIGIFVAVACLTWDLNNWAEMDHGERTVTVITLGLAPVIMFVSGALTQLISGEN